MTESFASTPTDPSPSLLAGYQAAPGAFDELLSADPTVRATWQHLMTRLARTGTSHISQRAEQAARLLRENGVTYNVVGAPEGPDRPWELDPLPLLFSRAEWLKLSSGIAQRARLLNALLADLYGPRRLLAERILPPPLVYEHEGFLFPCRELPPLGGAHLTLYAANLARRADGTWCVLGDRTQGPSGAGYAVENRVVISRTLPRDFESLHIERLAPFFITLRETLRGIAPSHRDNPRVVLLSPGPRSSRYFEDGYLARYLGYALVEGGDLTVRGEHAYLKTLGGLLPVDVILRRVLDEDSDPLDLRPDSQVGTPGLLQAARAGNLALANAAGSGFIEAPVWQAFWAKVCPFLLGEELQLPCKPTWWCANPDDLRHVEANFSALLVRRAFTHRNAPAVLVADLTKDQREQLWRRILQRPAQFVAQQPLARSTIPTWSGSAIVPAQLVLRAFAVRACGSYEVMPGGLCRVAREGASLGESASSGQSSKDVWVLSDEPVKTVTLLPKATSAIELRRSTNDISSRVADNLFWLGRGVERAEAIVRLVRSCVVRLTNELEPTGLTELDLLVSAVSKQGTGAPLVPSGAVNGAARPGVTADQLRGQILAAVFDRQEPGSLVQLLDQVQRAASNVRDRLSVDNWRIINQLELSVLYPWEPHKARIGEILLLLNQVLNLLAAIGGLGTESMTRGPGWRFLDMGRRVERALQILGLARHTLVDPCSQLTSLLEAILEIADSSMTYRHRYLASLQLAPLLDLVFVDETNPRAVGYQCNALSEHVDALPGDATRASRTPEQRIMLAAQSTLRLTDVEALCEPGPTGRREALERFVLSLEGQLRQLSESITRRYLSHTAPVRQFETIPLA